MKQSPSGSRPTLPVSIVKPVLLGLTVFIVLFSLINNGSIGNEMVHRYLAGHTVSRVTTALFLVGLASLAMIGLDVLRQKRLLASISLRIPGTGDSAGPDSAEGTAEPENTEPAEPLATTAELQAHLARYAVSMQRTWLWRRLHTALEYIRRNGNADGLDDELKYASELDAEEKHERYAFARIMIWAIPMLGFLGTVLGISEALGGLDLGEGNDFQTMMSGLRSSLYVAFDTTALALTLAIVLMFLQFAIDRTESGLLTLVETRTREELALHWDVTNQSRDSGIQAIEAMGKKVVQASEHLVERQVRLWRSTIADAESAWVETVRGAQQSVQESLQQALDRSATALGDNLAETIQQSDDAVARRWEQWQVALSENARLLVEHQRQMLAHSDLISRTLAQISDLAELREALQEYLGANHSTSEFADASRQLSTAVRLLEFRFKELEQLAKTAHSPVRPVDLPPRRAA